MGVGSADRREETPGRGGRRADARSPARSRWSAVARKSIAGFRLREGMPIGCKVTLRGARMYEFLDRLISLALPRVRDFRGLSPKAFDGHGNYSLGLAEQLVFPELNPDKYTRAQGMNITMVHLDGERTTKRASCCAGSACRSTATMSRHAVTANRSLPPDIDP